MLRICLRKWLLLVLLTLVAWPVAAQASGGGAEKAEPAGPQFVDIGPITAPILKKDKVDQYLLLVVSLQVADQAAVDEIKKLMPAIKDSYLTALYGTLYAGNGLRAGLVDVDVVRNKLIEANKKVIPEGIVQNVFLQQVQQRPG